MKEAAGSGGTEEKPDAKPNAKPNAKGGALVQTGDDATLGIVVACVGAYRRLSPVRRWRCAGASARSSALAQM
ncbi:hypothetical protein [Eggerthella sinensis]|uniref:hypothetical protein n=1 Tax=Eggerthella sinensis TaxID=242230 RepID=UPI0022E3B926|nr:hypothetical protein [Eggerthella sinensis]